MYIPNRSNVIDVAGGVSGSAFVADIAVLLASGNTQGYDPSVPSGSNLSPGPISQRSLGFYRERGDGAPRASVREHHSSLDEFQHDKVGASTALRSVVVQKQSVGFGGRENHGDVVGVGVQSREGHVGELVEPEGRPLAVTSVSALDATAPVAGLLADAETSVKAGVRPAGVGEDLAVVAPVAGTAQAEEARAVGTLLAGAAVVAGVAGAGVSAL